MQIIGGTVFGPDRLFRRADIYMAGGVFTRPGDPDAADEVLQAAGCYVIPGLVDIHTHGAMGCDASDGDGAGLVAMSRYYAKSGTTTFLATTMTLPEQTLLAAMDRVRDFIRPADGAWCGGVHLEGPFLNYKKRGAQAGEHLHTPDAELFRRLQDESDGQVRLVTVAPEEPGSAAFIERVSQECTVSLGHTTADYDTARRAFAAGASHATHLYNAMQPFAHRDPGVVGAALDSGATVELICDGLHIHPAVVRGTQRMFGDHLILVSDSVRCAGMPDGQYTLGGQDIFVKAGKATLEDGTLAGSSICLLDAVRNLHAFGIPLERAVYAATLAPAKVARLDGRVGSIEPGKQADCLILGEDLSLKHVVIGGKLLDLQI